MKSLFVIILILKQVGKIPMHQQEREQLYFLKCMIYLFCSSIHSIVLSITVPLGAIVMLIIYFVDTANKKIKLELIFTGLMVVFLSSVSFKSLTRPLQDMYFTNLLFDVKKLEVYSYTPSYEQFLFEVDSPESISEWINLLSASSPNSSWNYKTIPQSSGYKITLHSSDGSTSLIATNQNLNEKNLFIDDFYLAFYNPYLIEAIEKVHPTNPEVLAINTKTESMINITNETILNKLWQTIIWSSKENVNSNQVDEFTISAYLFFENNLGCRMAFNADFSQAYIQDQGVINLAANMQKILYEQYVLGQLRTVSAFQDFEPIHTSNPVSTTTKFSIEGDDDELFFGLYREDYKSDEVVFLHSVTSLDSKFFILKTPYILLLDQKGASQHDLMLVNQNVPESHRYVVKYQNIVPDSIAICPQNITFTYIIDNQEMSTLFYVNNYYQSPKPIVSGKIYDSVFLSDKYLAFTQELENYNVLCVYDTQQGQIVKYIYIEGDIDFIDSNNNQILFAVQQVDDLILKEGIFILHDDLSLSVSNTTSLD